MKRRDLPKILSVALFSPAVLFARAKQTVYGANRGSEKLQERWVDAFNALDDDPRVNKMNFNIQKTRHGPRVIVSGGLPQAEVTYRGWALGIDGHPANPVTGIYSGEGLIALRERLKANPDALGVELWDLITRTTP